MALVRWEPIRELNSLQSEVNRLFNGFFDTQTRPAPGMPGRWIPPLDLVEGAEHLVLRADLPGLSEEDVQIEFENDVLTISGERHAQHEGREEGFFRLERAFGRFQRSLRLPEGTDGDAITASFDRGVLEVRVPKPERRKPRRVAIGTGGAA